MDLPLLASKFAFAIWTRRHIRFYFSWLSVKTNLWDFGVKLSDLRKWCIEQYSKCIKWFDINDMTFNCLKNIFFTCITSNVYDLWYIKYLFWSTTFFYLAVEFLINVPLLLVCLLQTAIRCSKAAVVSTRVNITNLNSKMLCIHCSSDSSLVRWGAHVTGVMQQQCTDITITYVVTHFRCLEHANVNEINGVGWNLINEWTLLNQSN